MEPISEAVKQAPSQIKVKYVECSKSGLHYGQVCNMVCMEPCCLEDLICCCACIEESHKKHLTKPLKMIMTQAKSQSDLVKPTNFNIDVILDIMSNSQKATLERFHNCKKQILNNLDAIEKSLVGYYNSICEQIRLKNSDPKVEINSAFSAIEAASSAQSLKSWVKKLVAMIPTTKGSQDQQASNISEPELIDSLNLCNQEINKMISTNIAQVNSKLQEYQKGLETSVNSTNIWKKSVSYKFSPIFKHNDVKLITDYQVKSQNISSYKFAVMEPSIEKGSKIKTFHFKIKECSSNWVAVGLCHKNMIVAKNYGFNFNNLGHGGYMISANGGTWSNSNVQFNNKVKAFKFIKGDVITVLVDLNTLKITFKKKAESFEIPFQTIQGNQLYPCALFYYVNDEVQFLPDYKP